MLHLCAMPGIQVHDLRRQRTTLATVLFLAVAMFILCWGQVRGDLDRTIALGMIGACATVYIGLLNYWLQRDKVMQDLFTAFNARYDRLNDGLIALLKGTYPGDPDRVVVDYLNLCAEGTSGIPVAVSIGLFGRLGATAWRTGCRFR